MNCSYYKHCIVPGCRSTTIKTPDKLFVYVPNNQNVRKKWLKLAGRDDATNLSVKSRMYFCEDHFDLPNDMRNYTEYRIMGSVSQVQMKPGCIPSKFVCQENLKQTSSGMECTKQPTNKKSKAKLKKQTIEIKIERLDEPEISSLPSTLFEDNSFKSSDFEPVVENVLKTVKQTADKSIQVFLTLKHSRSIAVQTNVETMDKAVSP